MQNVFVLGGTGFVGAHVCEKLVQQGWQLTVPTRRWDNARSILHLPQVDVLELDVHDEAALTQAMAGHDAVVNLIALLHGSPAAFQKVHVALPQKIARACMATGVKQLVHVSALGVNGQQPDSAPSHYLRSKGQGEAALVQAAGTGVNAAFNLTILRPSVIFGAEDHFLNLFAKLQKVFPVMPLAGAHTRFQPVWVQDVALAVVRSLERPPTLGHTPCVVEVCGPDIFTLKQLVQLSAQLAGVNKGWGRPVIPLPLWVGRIQALMLELAPGPTLMSRDNLNSMRMDNVATGLLPGLESLGIKAAALRPIAAEYLSSDWANQGLLGLRQRVR
jgi:NADH dehydrogenase